MAAAAAADARWCGTMRMLNTALHTGHVLPATVRAALPVLASMRDLLDERVEVTVCAESVGLLVRDCRMHGYINIRGSASWCGIAQGHAERDDTHSWPQIDEFAAAFRQLVVRTRGTPSR